MAFLERIITRKALAQTYIFSGPEGVGKLQIAKTFAQKASQLPRENHPDVLTITSQVKEDNITSAKKKKDISIKEIRQVQKFLSLSPLEGKYRVLIIDDAHLLTVQAQNALLKVLEEPNSSSLVILVTSRKEKILSTIVSRCQRVNFGLVSQKELERYVQKNNLADTNETQWLIQTGRPRWLSQKSALLNEVRREMLKIISDDLTSKMHLAEELAKDVPMAVEKLKLYLIMVRSIYLSEILKPQWKLKISKNRAFNLALEIKKTIKLLQDTNTNARLIIENLFLSADHHKKI